MHLISLLGIISALQVCTQAINVTSSDEWEDFKARFKKSYKTLAEEEKRSGIFMENLARFEEHNRRYEDGNVTFTQGVNRDADLTDYEVRNKYGGEPLSFYEYFKLFKVIKEVRPRHLYPGNNSTPDELDWRDRDAVTPIKDQGECGSCWAFASIATLESHNFINTGKLYNLSEQQLLDCSDNFGCNGGVMRGPFNYFIENKIALERDYPYEGEQGECRSGEVNKTDVRAFGYATISNDIETIKSIVSEHGPVLVLVDGSLTDFRFYSGGVYTYPGCSAYYKNHAMVIVGYGHDNRTDLDYWILKNSWSTDWGEDGYMRMDVENTLCGIIGEATFPLFDDYELNPIAYFPNVFPLLFGDLETINVIIIVAPVMICVLCCCLCCFFKRGSCERR